MVADLVADPQRAGIWPITHYLARWQRASSSATCGLGPCDQDSVMEFGFSNNTSGGGDLEASEEHISNRLSRGTCADVLHGARPLPISHRIIQFWRQVSATRCDSHSRRHKRPITSPWQNWTEPAIRILVIIYYVRIVDRKFAEAVVWMRIANYNWMLGKLRLLSLTYVGLYSRLFLRVQVPTPCSSSLSFVPLPFLYPFRPPPIWERCN